MKKELEKFLNNTTEEIKNLDFEKIDEAKRKEIENLIVKADKQLKTLLNRDVNLHKAIHESNYVKNKDTISNVGAYQVLAAFNLLLLFAIGKNIENINEQTRLSEKLRDINQNYDTYKKIVTDYYFLNNKDLTEILLSDKTISEIRNEQTMLLQELNNCAEAIKKETKNHNAFSKAIHLIWEFDTTKGLDADNVKVVLSYVNDLFSANVNEQDVVNIATLNQVIMNNNFDLDIKTEFTRELLQELSDQATNEKNKVLDVEFER